MKEILLTSSVLILALLTLRRLFRRTISRRMQYALWALVLVRLLVPVNVGTLAHNVLSAAEPVQTAVEERLDAPVMYVRNGTERHPVQLVDDNAPQGGPQSPPSDAAQSAPADEYYTVTPTYRTVTLSEALTYVWCAGMLGVGAWFLFTNLRFARALRRARLPYRVENCRYPVYLVSDLSSPCLFGALRPAIYLNAAAVSSPETLRFVLAHEQTHARHLDPLWSLLRGVCLTIYWFDPLVWLAALLSREDCELACDEGTLRALGTEERAAYGKTLLSLVPVCDKPQNPLLGATTMTSGKRSLKERITRIAENRQTRAAAVFAVVALAVLVCAVSFTGAPDTPPEVTQEWYDAGFTTEDAQACLEFLDWAAGFDGDNAAGASWMADGKASLDALEPRAEFARVVRSIRMEELSPFTSLDGEVRYTLGFNDGRASYGFGLSENGQITLIAPKKVEDKGEAVLYKTSVAVVDNAELTQALYRLLRPYLLYDLTETQRSTVDEFLRWAQGLRAEDILHLQFQDGSSSRYLLDGELTAFAEQLVPALNALTEADLYTQQGYGDSAYYTLTVDMQDGERYTFFCGFDSVRLSHPDFEPALSSRYPSDRPTLWIDSPALLACVNALGAPPAQLPEPETVEPTPRADILPVREPWLTIPLAGKAYHIADRRVPSSELDWLEQMDMDGDGVCEIVNSSPNFPAIYYKRGGELYGIDLKSVITAVWPELEWWDYVLPDTAARCISVKGTLKEENGWRPDAVRLVYFDGENLLLYQPDQTTVDHVRTAGVERGIPEEIVDRARAIVRAYYDDVKRHGGEEDRQSDFSYDDYRVSDLRYVNTETRYGVTVESYRFSYEFHSARPETVVLAGGMYCDEDGWVGELSCCGGTDDPYIVCRVDGGERRILNGSISGEGSAGSPMYDAGMVCLLAENGLLRPGELDAAGLYSVMSTSGTSFLNWMGGYDESEQFAALEALRAYRASLTDSYDRDFYDRCVTYLLSGPGGLSTAGEQAYSRFCAAFG